MGLHSHFTFYKWLTVIAFIIAFPVLGLIALIGLTMFMVGGK